MDATLLQLFTVEELFECVAVKKRTGCLHIFTILESANIFFREGTVVAAAKGSTEGVEVLKEVLSWKEPRVTWEAEASPAGHPFKPLKIDVAAFMSQAPAKEEKVEEREKVEVEVPDILKGVHSDRTVVVLKKNKALLTSPVALPPEEKPVPPPTPVIESVTPVKMTATRNMTSTSQLRSAQEKALLEKHQFSLLSVDNPEQRIKVTRASTLIGRNPACDLTIDHGSVSRQHCLMQLTDRGLHVKDLGTTNGTKVNGIALTEGYVNIEDKLTVGHLTFIVKKD